MEISIHRVIEVKKKKGKKKKNYGSNNALKFKGGILILKRSDGKLIIEGIDFTPDTE